MLSSGTRCCSILFLYLLLDRFPRSRVEACDHHLPDRVVNIRSYAILGQDLIHLSWSLLSHPPKNPILFYWQRSVVLVGSFQLAFSWNDEEMEMLSKCGLRRLCLTGDLPVVWVQFDSDGSIWFYFRMEWSGDAEKMDAQPFLWSTGWSACCFSSSLIWLRFSFSMWCGMISHYSSILTYPRPARMVKHLQQLCAVQLISCTSFELDWITY